MNRRDIPRIAVAIILALAHPALGQRYPFFSYTTAAGLPHNNITALTQDGRGFLWIGTDEAGVCRFDGKEFVAFDTHGAGIPNSIRSLAVDGSKHVFIGTTAGLRCLSLSPHAIDSPDTALNRFLSVWKDEIVRLSVPRPGELLLATRTYEAHIDYRRQRTLRHHVLDPDSVSRALLRVAGVTDRRRRTWTVDESAVRCVTPGGTLLLDERNGIRPSSVRVMLCDREGSLWFGTSSGLIRLTPDRIVSYTEGNGLPEDILGVWRIAEEPGRGTWFSTIGKGAVCLADSGSTSYTAMRGLRSGAVNDIILLASGMKIVGTLDGLHLVDGNRVRVISTKDGLPDDRVEFVLPSKFGGYWISTRRGLVRLTQERIDVFTERDGLPSNRVTQCVEDSHGDLWVGTHAGVCTMTRTAGYRVTILPELKGVRIASTFLDRRDRPWFGSMGSGVYALIDGRFMHITRTEGLAGNTVYFISQDRQGTMYFGTNAGITVLPEENIPLYAQSDSAGAGLLGLPSAYLSVRKSTGMFTIDTETGLVNNEMNSGAVARDSSGNMWFGSIGGVSRYTPLEHGSATDGQTADRLSPRDIFVTRLQVGDTPIPVTDSLRLGPDDQYLQLRWAVPSYRNPGAVRVVYRLDGLEFSWHESADGIIMYSGLPSGTYTLVARATIGEGIWTGEHSLLSIVVDPPYYLTFWFWLLVLALLSGLGYLWHRIRTAQLVEIERMRTRIALDLHDDIGTSLSTIFLLGDAERRTRKGSESDRLERIISLARNSVDSMSDIVWSINPAKDTVRSLAERMREVAETAARAVNIDMKYSFDERLAHQNLNVYARRHALLLFKEAVNNAVKHAECTRLECTLQRSKGWLDIMIRDNGRGFDPGGEFRGNGVRSMQRRATEMRWDMKIDSSPSGTEIHVRIPLEK